MCSCVQLSAPFWVYVCEFYFYLEFLVFTWDFAYLCKQNLLIMSDFTIFIKLPAYEKEWCEHHFGRPCQFPAQSNVNNVIRHFLRLRPSDALPEEKMDDEVAICIPYSQSKKPESYNYLSKPGKLAIAEAINDLFSMQMFEDLTSVAVRNVPVKYLIEDWMYKNGIKDDNYDNLKQKFTRIKDSYRKHGINISRGYKHESVKK